MKITLNIHPQTWKKILRLNAALNNTMTPEEFAEWMFLSGGISTAEQILKTRQLTTKMGLVQPRRASGEGVRDE